MSATEDNPFALSAEGKDQLQRLTFLALNTCTQAIGVHACCGAPHTTVCLSHWHEDVPVAGWLPLRQLLLAERQAASDWHILTPGVTRHTVVCRAHGIISMPETHVRCSESYHILPENPGAVITGGRVRRQQLLPRVQLQQQHCQMCSCVVLLL